MSGEKPTLWHIDISHFSEKARWALAWKGVEHRRRASPVGSHMAVALWLTRGRQATFPVLRLDGRNIGDSTAIIAALEERYPEAPLYPADEAARRRALALEDYFDEELGPQVRLLAWHEFGNDPESFEALVRQTSPPPMRRFSRPAAVYARTFTSLRFRVRRPERAEQARVKVTEALDRVEAELGDREYLVGDSFTVADLTAASLFYPLVVPPESPIHDDSTQAAGFERFREPLKERRGYKWVEEMFRRHRKPAATAPGGAATSA